jgi:hypothetical protein
VETCAVFDLDGVLVDTRQAVYHAYAEAGVVMPRSAWGSPWQSWLIDLCDHDPDRASDVHDHKSGVYPAMLKKYAVALPLSYYFNSLQRRGFPVFVITGASLEGASAAMKIGKIDTENLYDYGLTTRQKTKTLAYFSANLFDVGVYYDDQDGVKVPDDWAAVKVRY